MEGKYIRRALKTTSWERAEELERELIRNAEIKTPAAPIPNIGEAIAKFLADAEHGRKLTKGTLKKYRVLLTQLKNFAATRGLAELCEISVDVARQFRESWEDGPISSTKKLERFRAFCRFRAAKPLVLRDRHAIMTLTIYWANEKHADPESVFGSIADALFENDKHVAGAFTFVHAEDKKGKVEVEITV